MRIFKCNGNKLLLKELKGCYRFFTKECNYNESSLGYGLIRDKSKYANDISSIASVGYGFAALVIGTNRKWINHEKAYKICSKTLDTFINNVDCINGFFYHFINMKTGKREWNCEVSIIDTAIFICGALLAGEYFGGEVQKKADQLYKNINWQWYLNKDTNQFYIGYTPERGFWGKWDMYAEQLMIYVLAVASPTYPVDKSVYSDFDKPVGKYKGINNIIFTYCGTLFTYQFSHGWIDFRDTVDGNGINWFDNSIKATRANRQYCIDNKEKFKTFGENSWGLTACVGPKGYSGGYGAMPAYSDLDSQNNGTITPCGAAGSIVFTPKDCINALEYYYNYFPKLWKKYGFIDAYNLSDSKQWYSKEYIGIDKGISLIMIENYLTGLIWKHFMNNTYIQKGMNTLKITKINKLNVKNTDKVKI